MDGFLRPSIPIPPVGVQVAKAKLDLVAVGIPQVQAPAYGVVGSPRRLSRRRRELTVFAAAGLLSTHLGHAIPPPGAA